MSKMTLTDLRRLAVKLQAALGQYWTIRVLTQKECEEEGRTFDPPVAYLEARCYLGHVYICADGEVYIQSHRDSRGPLVFQAPLPCAPEFLTQKVLQGLASRP